MNFKIIISLLICQALACCIFSACDFPANSPPLYQTKAKAFLEKKGIEKSLIMRLVERGELTAAEAERLSQFDNIAVLHLLSSNHSIPQSLIKHLSHHKHFEVKTGIASNPQTPLKILHYLRTTGEYTTINDYIARNPNLPHNLLFEMNNRGEASYTSLGLNPNCPAELMNEIAKLGTEIDRAWLATNPNLTKPLILLLEDDNSKVVKAYLKTNPAYLKMIDEVQN
ncbi:MAG: hypothetical protein GY694_11510 [Gammaproteobacteria bacterium]|nr:hypothetical protein [Gammaproteobacteria bacterium]